jgi:hypothetical protein
LLQSARVLIARQHSGSWTATLGNTDTSKRFMPQERPNSPDPVPVTSSIPEELPEKQQALFREVLRLFEKQRIPYAVSGAFALREHTGIYRFTKDLDLFLAAENIPCAVACLQHNGFETEICDQVWLAKAHRDDFYVDLITGMSNAALVVENSWLDRARPALLCGVETRVLAPEELIASKLFVTRRERFDGADIVHIIYRTEGRLDWNRLIDIVGEHWEILFWDLVLFHYVYPAQSQYVPDSLWQDLIGRFLDAVNRPDPHARFRGSLVDEFMFAIDLKEWRLENVLAEYRARRLLAHFHRTRAGHPNLAEPR